MTLWFCQNCVLSNCEDCGPWDDTNEYFHNIKLAHNGHRGFQIGEPQSISKLTNTEQAFTDYFNDYINEWYQQLILESKGHDKVCLNNNKWKWVSQT